MKGYLSLLRVMLLRMSARASLDPRYEFLKMKEMCLRALTSAVSGSPPLDQYLGTFPVLIEPGLPLQLLIWTLKVAKFLPGCGKHGIWTS